MSLLKTKLTGWRPWFSREGNGTRVIQIAFSLLCIVLVWWFFLHEQKELSRVPDMIRQAQPFWLSFGILLTVLYILLQALMYRMAFKAAKADTGLMDMVVLFLKRNLFSVFLPAGGVSSLAFFGQPLERKGISSTRIHLASALYGFIGVVSLILVAIPAFISTFFYVSLGRASWLALGLTILLTAGLLLLYRSIQQGGAFKVWLEKKIPALRMILEEISGNQLERRYVVLTIFYSFLIEICGIVHVYISMKALGEPAMLLAAVMGYVVAVIFMLISPFLRGVGAVEFSMAFLLTRFGFDEGTALSVTMLFRFFEFWLPLLAGMAAFVLSWNKIVLRVVPAALLMLSGLVNILSVLTPALSGRLFRLREFIPVDISHASNFLVFTVGIFMLSTGLFLLRAQRSAWVFACVLSAVSVAGNLLKAYDYEEALLSAGVLLSLWITRKQYFVKSASFRPAGGGVLVLLICAVITLLYGVMGFYFIDSSHFQQSFTFAESFRYGLREFFFLDNTYLATDASGRLFLHSIHLMSFTCFSFVLFLVVKAWLSRIKWTHNESHEAAADFTREHGSSSLDYFKYYPDKQLFWSANGGALISFKVSGAYAVVLEKPVGANARESKQCVLEFEDYCAGLGYAPVYYRVNENDLDLFKGLNKKHFFLGQEAVVDLHSFSLEGKERKSLRNAVNKLKSSGFECKIYNAPLPDDILNRLEEVSDDWLQENGKTELVFAEGMFIREAIAACDVVTLERDNEVFAFLNIIPDHAPNEGTYDLIRKREDAPNGAMDGLLLEMFQYFREKGLQYVNLGMAPMSGLEKAGTLGEHVIKFAYEHTSRYEHYKGLREFKEKYDPVWHSTYLLYTDDFQLLGITRALRSVMNAD